MSGIPKGDRGEVAFIGKSNVGKSSLINMITNRKSLAYTSKRPGKTQQYNYFAINDKPELRREIRFGDDVEGEKDEVRTTPVFIMHQFFFVPYAYICSK